MQEMSEFLIRPEVSLRDGRTINSIADAVAYVREHEVRPGVDTRDEVLHRLERARTQREREGAAEAFLSWLEGLDLVALPQLGGLGSGATPRTEGQAADVGATVRELASDAGEKIKQALADRQNAGADYVAGLAETVRRVSHEFDGQMPQAGQYIRTAARQMDNLSEALRTRDATGLAREVKDFARREPAIFICGAVLAGFAVVRFLKSGRERSA